MKGSVERRQMPPRRKGGLTYLGIELLYTTGLLNNPLCVRVKTLLLGGVDNGLGTCSDFLGCDSLRARSAGVSVTTLAIVAVPFLDVSRA